MKRFELKIKGITPLLQHRMSEDDLFSLLGSKTERKRDKEPETPREIAERYVYKNGLSECVVPTAYISGAFRSVASDYKQKNSTKKSVKAIAGGVFRPEQEFAVLIDENEVPIKDFEVDIRKATNHQRGAVAVCRPRFDRWNIKLVITIDTNLVSPDVVLQMLNDAGRRSGIGSFRVSRGGYFGQFNVVGFNELND